MKENIYAFIDSQNLHQGIKHTRWKLDYKKFMSYLRTKYKVSKAYLFIGYIPENAPLYKELQEIGFVLVFKNVLEITKNGKKTYKGNVDAELVLTATDLQNEYSQAILVTGDGDFFCLVEYLEKKGKLLKILVPTAKFSSLLRKYSKFIVSMQSLKEKLKQ